MIALGRVVVFGSVAVGLLMLGGCSRVASKATVVWQWHQGNTELYHPRVSPDGTEIALVRKHHIPDGHEAESIPEEQMQKEFRHIDQDERYADPEVVVLRVGSDQVTQIDWGWAPVFSPDGGQIAYAHQKKPLSRFRILAETLAGNDIRIYDRTRRATGVVAVPEAGYLADPMFAPGGRHLVYSIGGAVNGAYGGNIGLARVALDSHRIELLYPVSRDYNLYHLIDPKGFVSGRLLAVRQRPATPGYYLADEYDCELLEIGPPPTVVYSWGRRKLSGRTGLAFAQGADGKVLVYHTAWRAVGEEATGPAASATDQSAGLPSPNGVLVAVGSESRVTVRELQSGVVRREWNFGGPVQHIAWSPDSRRLAVIVTNYRDREEEIFDFDELLVLEP